MPKIIQPRRHDKELSVQEFWKIKNQGKKLKQVNAFHAYREEQVQQRHRYQKPSQQAKTFNPLTFILKKQNRAQSNDLYKIGTQDENTFVGQYLSSVQQKINPSIYQLKSLVMGRKSIVYNLQKVYNLLWSHLQLQQAFPLLQAVIKDSQGEKLQLWLQKGFEYLGQFINNSCATNFNKVIFKNLFDTICVLMQSYFKEIISNLQLYFKVYSENFMKHTNKYLRKFSIQSFSYLLSNLSEQQYQTFLNHLIRKQQEGFFDSKLRLADLLLQRLKIMKGCLTTASLTHFLTQIQSLEQIFIKNNNDKSRFVSISSDYIQLVLQSLNCKQGTHDNQLLFDFLYVIKALITFQQKKVENYTQMLIKGFSKYISIFKEDKKRFAPNTNLQSNYLAQVWQVFGDFFKRNYESFIFQQYLINAIGILTIKAGQSFYYNTNIIQFCKLHKAIVKSIIKTVYEDGQVFQGNLMEVILLLSKDLIRQFMLQDQEVQLIYCLVVLIKRFNLTKSIQLGWLQLNQTNIIQKLGKCNFENDLIVTLRFLTFIRIPEDTRKAVSQQLKLIYNKHVATYEEYFLNLSTSSKNEMTSNQLYDYSNFTKQIILYSHHEIPWLSHIFNIYESFILLQRHLGQQLESSTSIWDELIISRPSAINILTNKGLLVNHQSEKLTYNFLTSRNRQVRYNSLQILSRKCKSEQQMKLISWLMGIDENGISLDNERQVKRIFCNAEQYIQLLPQNIKSVIMLKWCLGFAFTGFKLIENAFISFLKNIIDSDMHSDCRQQIKLIYMPFLQYYNYRHSRQYQFDISADAPVSHLINAFKVNNNPQLTSYIKQDLQIYDIETVQWIGIERIAETFRISKLGKKSLGKRLQNMINGYFQIQFQRQNKSILSQNQSIPDKFLLPIKQRFLIIILKLCPHHILPPFQCLHFTRQIYFEIQSVKNIKRNNWQTMWEHKKSDQPRKKAQITDIASTTINLQHLSIEQQNLYINYLWKDMLESNRHKKRIILDHIRNYLPTGTHFIFSLLFSYLHLDKGLQKINQQTINSIVARLRLINRKSLLNGMFILKAILLHLRQEVNHDGRLKIISFFILAIIQIVYNSTHDEALLDQNQSQNENENANEDVDVDDEEEKADVQNNHIFQYKQHRKQLQKLLQTLFANHDLQIQSITELLQFLFINTKINLAKSSRLSVPGLLLILKTISLQKQYRPILIKVLDGQIITMLTDMIRADQQNQRPLRNCFQLWLQIMHNIIIGDQEQSDQISCCYQEEAQILMKRFVGPVLLSILSYINAKQSRFQHQLDGKSAQMKRKDQESIRFLHVIAKLMQICDQSLESGWQIYIWDEINKLTKLKRNMSQIHCQKLSSFIFILAQYIRLRGSLQNSEHFLKKIIGVLPSIRDSQQRIKIIQLIVANHKQLGLKQQSVKIVSRMCQMKKTALVVTMDFSLFFQSCNQYQQISSLLGVIDHQYYLYNLICFADNDELSVRRAVSTNCKYFLDFIQSKLKNEQQMEDQKDNNKIGYILLSLKIYRVFIQMLSKQNIQQNQAVYWNIVDNIDIFFSWICTYSQIISSHISESNVQIYPKLIAFNEENKSYLKLFSSIAESNKLKGLKLLRSTYQNLTPQIKTEIIQWKNHQIDLPNPIIKIILPILQYLILKPTENNKNNEGSKSNLSSTFSKTSLQLLPLIANFLKENFVKKELKKLISKLKYSETENKRNIALIKMIGGLIDGVQGQKVNQKLQVYLDEHGFQQFHQKITQFSKTISKEQLNQDQSDNQPQNPAKREKIPDYFERLDELQSQEAINRNFLHFDKKMMQLQFQENEDEQQTKFFPAFLKKNVLLPLRTMLMMQNKSKGQQQNSKSQVLLSVTITKVLLRLPLDVFLRQFQKVINRLGRLLKKRQIEIRDNSRSCLCEIAKSVGSQLLYAMIIELKFHLKDNFDRHVLNYTLAKILQNMELANGDLDYCLPLILPSVIDEIFGQSSSQKQMVQKNQVKTLKFEAKKHKGLQILQLVCKSISSSRLGFIIQFLQKYLREHLDSEVNLGKYDHMLGAITAGLAHNCSALNQENTHILLPLLSQPVTRLRQQIKQLNWDDGVKHENSLKKEWKRRKAGKQQILTLQQQAGRNGSIFKKMGKQIGERRNQQIIASSLIQFYIALLSFFIKRQVFTLGSITSNSQLSSYFLTLLGFLGECVDQRDNRLVTKSLKTLHIALTWSTSNLNGELQVINDRFKSIKKQTSRKILLLIQQLTLADQQLLKQCFVFLNDLISEASVTIEMLPNFISVIKLHTPTTQDLPHIPQTYQLLKTLIYKCPQYLYYQLLDQMHYFVRLRLPTCRNKQIRDLSCHILSVYLRPKNILLSSIQAFNLSQKKHGKKTIDYGKRLQQQLTFYLSNLECPGQEGVLNLLDQFIGNRQLEEIQIYSELLLLGLMTARTNQIQSNETNPFDKLIIKILNSINQSKILSLVEKCLFWTTQGRQTSIRLCGISFLKIIVQQSSLKINQNFIEKYVLSKNGILEQISSLLAQEASFYEAKKAEQKSSFQIDNNWNDIMEKMQVENSEYSVDVSVIQSLSILRYLLQNVNILNACSNNLTAITVSSWKLLHSKNKLLINEIVNCLEKYNILPILAKEDQFFNSKNNLSLKKTLSSLIFNHHTQIIIEKLIYKILVEESKLQIGSKHLQEVSWFLVGLILKAHIKTNLYQPVLPTLIQLLNRVALLKQDQAIDFRSIMFNVQNFRDKILEMSIKLSSNSLISSQSRILVQQTTQIIKEVIGSNEFFRAVGDYEVRRRQKKSDEKARIAQMAILNPTQFIDQKRGKIRKLQ